MQREKSSESDPGDFRVFVLGGTGMLGSEVVEGLRSAGVNAFSPPRQVADITNPETIRRALDRTEPPGLVINCAAYTAVDKAESEPEAAYAANRDGPAFLAAQCAKLGLPLIHISTDYVFNGKSDRPYAPDDPADPVNTYGKSKWEGEEAIRSRLAQHLIVRTSWLYGVRGANFVKTILRLGREREEIRIVSDQHGCPTWTSDLAGCIAGMAGRIVSSRGKVQWGTYHYCGRGITTWFDFALEILSNARQHEPLKVASVQPIPTVSYPTPAVRPHWSVLDCAKTVREFGTSAPDWKSSLKHMMEHLRLSEQDTH